MLIQAKNPYFENKLIKDIVQAHPETGEILEKYFGEDCLQRISFKIKPLR
jgi:hypothetical protein